MSSVLVLLLRLRQACVHMALTRSVRLKNFKFFLNNFEWQKNKYLLLLLQAR